MKIYIREVLSTLVLVAQMGASNQYIPTEVFFEIFNYLGQKREIFLYCTFLRLYCGSAIMHHLSAFKENKLNHAAAFQRIFLSPIECSLCALKGYLVAI